MATVNPFLDIDPFIGLKVLTEEIKHLNNPIESSIT